MPELDDDKLIIRIATGDKPSFAAFLTRHLTSVVKFAHRYTGNRADAEDIAQDTFARIWQRASDWQPRGVTPRAWMYRISYNLCIDFLRKKRPHTNAEIIEFPTDPKDDPEQQYVSGKQDERLQQALTALPQRQLTALTLCVWQGLSNKEAAACMDIKVDALESLLSRARRKLKQLLSVDTNTQPGTGTRYDT